jgi:hypothetical protein
MLDESSLPVAKPLLGAETLRRLAWSIYFLDATIDGGNFGFSTIRDGAFTIQLPCDERPFLLQTPMKTEPLLPQATMATGSSGLGLSAHLIRSMTARQAIADVHSRISRRLIEPDQIPEAVETAERHARRLLDTFPAAMSYSRAQYHAFRDQVPIMVHLHLMRQTVHRHISLLRILSAAHLHYGTAEVSQHRATLVQSAKETSRVVFDALEHRVTLDPQNAMHAYNAIEILLFQPIRQSAERAQDIITREEVAIALKPLLQVIRDLAKVCELVALLVSSMFQDLTDASSLRLSTG